MATRSQPDYPFEERGPLKQPGRARMQASDALRSSGDDGPGAARNDLARARGQLTRVPQVAGPPRWVLSFVERRARPAELIERLRARSSALRTARSQAEAIAVLNELGRSPTAAANLRDALTSELIAEIAASAKETGR